MKKILGFMSLIAIFTLSVAQAYAGLPDNIDHKVEFVVTHSSTVTVDTVAVEVPKVFGVFNFVVDEPTLASKEGASNANIVSRVFDNSKFGKSFAEVHLPFEVGLTSKSSTNIVTLKTSNTYAEPRITNRKVNSRYTDLHEPVGWNSYGFLNEGGFAHRGCDGVEYSPCSSGRGPRFRPNREDSVLSPNSDTAF